MIIVLFSVTITTLDIENIKGTLKKKTIFTY